MLLDGISRFTTDPAATILFSPIVTPPQIVTLEQIQHPSFMDIGEAVFPSHVFSPLSAVRIFY